MIVFEISAINLLLTGLFLHWPLKDLLVVRPAVWVDSRSD